MRFVTIWVLVSLAGCKTTTVAPQVSTERDTGPVVAFKSNSEGAGFSVGDGKYLVTAAKSSDGKTIGKLGQAREATAIYSKPDAHSVVYYRLAKLQYVVINSTPTSGWTGVLLQDGRTGYVAESMVAQLPYDVNQKPGGNQYKFQVSSDSIGKRLAETAVGYAGLKYRTGGDSLVTGVDAPSFVRLVFAQCKVALPTSIKAQCESGTPVKRLEELQPGDRLYFWGEKEGRIMDAGIFMGFLDSHSYFIHASAAKGKVTTDDLSESRWRDALETARRSPPP